MPVTRATSTDRGYTDDCRRAVYARGHAGHAELTQAESTPVYPPTLPMAPKRARLYSPRRYMLTAQASTRAYLALTVEDVFVFHAHAFNIALLLAVDPPTAQEAETKPGAQWEASFTTHQHAQTKLTPSVKVEHLAHVTVASFSCSRHATCTALTDTVQSRHTPGQPRV